MATLPAPPNVEGGHCVPPFTPADIEGRDAGALLTQWVRDEVPDGALVDLTGVWGCDTSVYLPDRRLIIQGGVLQMRGDGTQATKPSWLVDRLWPRERAGLFVERGEVDVIGMIVSGANPSGGKSTQATEEQAGFELRGVDRAQLLGCSALGMLGGGVTIGHDDDRKHSTGVRIDEFSAVDVARNGIAVVNGSDVDVSRLNAQGCGHSVVNLEPAVATWRASRVRVRHVTVSRQSSPVLASLGEGHLVSDVEVTDVWGIDGPVRATVECDDTEPKARFLLDGWRTNYSHGGPAAFRFTGISGVTMRNCTIPVNPKCDPSR